ncbi:NUDIX hydrolase [Streptomyces smyrnaeus]|uniref:NUDIX hydrolase n=1 Tax=Streptomyces smyrnaeus TaxID=1387713 RepID=A0ABS3XN98_9ACTN|nr:NUDIX hydrolase [Streptomyces smyrnaeus]MBO8196875.1 NUDIX hydrolase [Streptomyces smyrnaeus]
MTSTPRTPATTTAPASAPSARRATATAAPLPQDELAAYLAAHPAPAAAVDAVIRDERGRLLVVDPVYKAGWDLPGGMVDDEGLVDALVRELREELRPAALRVGRLLAVDNVPATVYGRALTACVYAVQLPYPVTVRDLRLQPDELRAAEFLPQDEALCRLPERLRRRTAAALGAERGAHTAHLLDGHPAPLDDRDRRALLPSPAVAAAALVTDGTGRVLVRDAGAAGDTRDTWAAWDEGATWRLPGTLVSATETPAEGAARALETQLGRAAGVSVGRLLTVDSTRCPAGGRTLITHLFEAHVALPEHPGAARLLPADEALRALPPHEARLLRSSPGRTPGAQGPTEE